jgi:hypothetical protein
MSAAQARQVARAASGPVVAAGVVTGGILRGVGDGGGS